MKLLFEIVNAAENVSFGSTGSPGVTEIRGKSARTATTPPSIVNAAEIAPMVILRSDVPDCVLAALCLCFFGLDFGALFDIADPRLI